MALNAPLPQLIQEGFGFPAGTIQVFKSELTYTGLSTPDEHEKLLATRPDAIRQANISLVLYGHQLDENGQIIGDPDKPHKQYLKATGRNEGWYDKNGEGGTEASYKLVSYKANADGSIDMSSVQVLAPNEEIDEETGKYGPQPVGVGIDFPGTQQTLGRFTAAAKYLEQLSKHGLDKAKIPDAFPLVGCVPLVITCHQEKKTNTDKASGNTFDFTEFVVDAVHSFPYDAPAKASAPATSKAAASAPKSAPATPKAAAAPAPKSAPAKSAPAPAPAATAASDEDIAGALEVLSTEMRAGTLVEMILRTQAKGFIQTLSELEINLGQVSSWLKANGTYTAANGMTITVNDKNKWVFTAATA